MSRGNIVRIVDGHYAGGLGMVIQVHDASVRARRFDVALDGYDSVRCFGDWEMERYDGDGL